MVEFAIVLPILLVLVFGIIQFGITVQPLPDAHRRGAGRGAAGSRQPDASRHPAAAAAEARVRSAASGSLSDADDPDVTVTPYDP